MVRCDRDWVLIELAFCGDTASAIEYHGIISSNVRTRMTFKTWARAYFWQATAFELEDSVQMQQSFAVTLCDVWKHSVTYNELLFLVMLRAILS